MSNSWAVVITAAGSSRRMGDDTKKELAVIEGRPVLELAALPFCSIAEISTIVVTSRAEDLATYRRILEVLPVAKTIVIPGGATRQDSVRKGLESLLPIHPDFVLIHDAARPWVTTELIRRVMQVTEEKGACVPVTSATSALKRVAGNRCIEHIDRREVCYAQTPQGFTFSTILDAHRKVSATGEQYADDAEVYASQNLDVFTAQGDPQNRKITHPHDLAGI